MSIIDYFTHVVVVKRPKPQQDKYGGQTERTEVKGTFLARPENLSGIEQEYNQQNTAQVFDRIFSTADCNAQELDILELRTKDTNDLVDTYEVRRVQPMRQTQNIHHNEYDVMVYK